MGVLQLEQCLARELEQNSAVHLRVKFVTSFQRDELCGV